MTSSDVLNDLKTIREAYLFLTDAQRMEPRFKALLQRYDLAARLLDPVLYRTYMLYYVGGLSQESCAVIMHCSRQFVWSCCRRLVQQLMYLLAEGPVKGGGA